MNYIYLAVGLALLVKGADYLIDGASALAQRFRIPSLIIGLTVVAVGTSLPEFVINLLSAIRGSTGIAFGNVVGSNIANTLLILGVAALIYPPKLQHSTVWREIPFSLLAALVLFAISNLPPIGLSPQGAFLSRADGLVLWSFLIAFIYYLYRSTVQSRADLVDERMEIETLPSNKITLFIIAGIISLYLGGSWTVNGAVAIARGFGISEFLISATVIAFGTSLPELITSTKAAYRKDSDLAVGNVVGSNILNIFFVLGTTALITPVAIPGTINIDSAFMIISSLLLFVFMFIGQKHTLSRWQGAIFVTGYIGYILLAIARIV